MDEASTSDLAAQLAELAAQQVERTRNTCGVELDYSENSLLEADRLITAGAGDEADLEDTMVGFGAYVGEVIRRNLGGRWVQHEEFGSHLEAIGKDFKAFPLAWAQRRFERGKEIAFTYKYAGLRGKVTGDEAASQALLTRLRELNLGPVSAPVEVKVTDALARAPLLVFMLVAAADGEVKPEEQAMLADLAQNAEVFSSDLFQAAVAEMSRQATRFIGEFQQDGFDCMAALTEVAGFLDSQHPDEADAFKQCLLGWGRAIGAASGVLPGRERTLAREEGMALTGVAIALGMLSPDDEAGSEQ